jgi:pyrroloquinoline quinone (PQQ) biosynthesis protein C
MITVYHAMRGAGPVMQVAIRESARLAHKCPVAGRLVEFWRDHAQEEAGHDEWLKADLRRLGVDIDVALSEPPAVEVAEMIGTLHFWILHTHPVAAVAYFYVVERSVMTVQFLDWLVEHGRIPRDALETFYKHARIDIEHGRELEHLVGSLPLTAAHYRLLELGAVTCIDQLARMLDRLIGRADASVREGCIIAEMCVASARPRGQ